MWHPHQPIATSWNNQELSPLGQGLGSFGLPGDFSTVSRFVRIAFLKSKIGNPINELNGISEFFHMLNNDLSSPAPSLHHKKKIILRFILPVCLSKRSLLLYHL